jgi:hypothetical protein
VRRYQGIGFEVERINATFGHGYYRRIPPLHALELLKMKFLHRFPMPYLASFVVIILRKPHVGYDGRTISTGAEASDRTFRNASG